MIARHGCRALQPAARRGRAVSGLVAGMTSPGCGRGSGRGRAGRAPSLVTHRLGVSGARTPNRGGACTPARAGRVARQWRHEQSRRAHRGRPTGGAPAVDGVRRVPAAPRDPRPGRAGPVGRRRRAARRLGGRPAPGGRRPGDTLAGPAAPPDGSAGARRAGAPPLPTAADRRPLGRGANGRARPDDLPRPRLGGVGLPPRLRRVPAVCARAAHRRPRAGVVVGRRLPGATALARGPVVPRPPPHRPPRGAGAGADRDPRRPGRPLRGRAAPPRARPARRPAGPAGGALDEPRTGRPGLRRRPRRPHGVSCSRPSRTPTRRSATCARW